jgi:DNA-binding NtrC family response regulator
VRELENLIEMLVVMKEEGELGLEDLPMKVRQNNVDVVSPVPIELTEDGIDFNNMVGQFERDLIVKALKKSSGVKNRAARLLGLNRTTLVEKLKRLNIAEAG